MNIIERMAEVMNEMDDEVEEYEKRGYKVEKRSEGDKEIIIVHEDVTEYERQAVEEREDGYFCPYCGRRILLPTPPKRCPWCQREFL